MPTRYRLAVGLISSTIAWLGTPQVKAADVPAAVIGSPVYAGLIPDDAFAAAVAYPRRVLNSEAVGGLKSQAVIDGLPEPLGVSLLNVEQIVVLLGRPESTPACPDGIQYAKIARLSKPCNQAELAKKLLKPWTAEEAEIAGQKYFRPSKHPRRAIYFSGPDPKHPVLGDASWGPCVCFLGDQTLIMASQSWLPKILAAKQAKSKLISALACLDPADDATFVFTSNDASKELLAKRSPFRTLVEPLPLIRDLLGRLQAARLSIRAKPAVSLKLMLVGKDFGSADKISKSISDIQAQLTLYLIPVVRRSPARPLSAAEWQQLVQNLFSRQEQEPHSTRPVNTPPKVVVDLIAPVVRWLPPPYATQSWQDASDEQRLGETTTAAVLPHSNAEVPGPIPSEMRLPPASRPAVSRPRVASPQVTLEPTGTGETLPGEQWEMRQLAIGVTSRFVNGLVPHEAGKQVTIEINDLGAFDALMDKLVLPALKMSGARSAVRRVESK